MTCGCTCGKHILVEINSLITAPAAAAQPTPYPVVFEGNTGAFQQMVRIDPLIGAACAPIPTIVHFQP